MELVVAINEFLIRKNWQSNEATKILYENNENKNGEIKRFQMVEEEKILI